MMCSDINQKFSISLRDSSDINQNFSLCSDICRSFSFCGDDGKRIGKARTQLVFVRVRMVYQTMLVRGESVMTAPHSRCTSCMRWPPGSSQHTTPARYQVLLTISEIVRP
jgi:hypothetical protein